LIADGDVVEITAERRAKDAVGAVEPQCAVASRCKKIVC
jgi:hypothetical protein